MANVKFKRKAFEKEIPLTEKVIEKISLFGTPLESISEEEIEIEIFPNRPDLLSIQGYLRSFNCFLGKKKKDYKISKSNAKIIVDQSVNEVRPYCMAAIVKGVAFNEDKIREIMQWQEKIHATIGRNRKKVALGYYTLDKVKFPVKYMTKSPKEIIFEPLDMPKKMNALEILTKHPCGKTYGHYLDGFKEFPVYYDSNNEVLSLPPIVNSNNSGKIVPGTSDILIECSGTDLDTLKKVISIAVVDLIELGGKAYSVEVMYGNKKEFINLKPETMHISLDNTNKLLGLNLKQKDIPGLLLKMGYDYESGKVKIPPWRADILHEVDIIEDIAIAYGYDNFAPEIPNIATTGSENIESKIKSKISEILIGLGLLEISTYHLIKLDEVQLTNLKDLIELENSKTDYKILRPNLLIPALRIFSENKDVEFPQKLFEIGTVFLKDRLNITETNIIEKNNLLIAISPGNFTEIKQILEYLSRLLNQKFDIEEHNEPNLIEGRTALISFNKEKIGYMGDLHPKTLNDWNIKAPISVIEISLEGIFKSLISNYPK